MAGWMKTSLFWLTVIIAATYGISYWLDNKSFIFTHGDLEDLAMKFKGTTIQKSFKTLVRDLKHRYGPHILDADKSSFFFVNAGGWMGQVCPLHVSLTEYVLVFNTVQESRGHSGRYWLNITDFVIDGWMEQWKEQTFRVENFTAGVTVFHPWLTSAGVHFGAGSWFLEYGRGFVPSSMFFASADAFFSTHDFISWFAMIKAFGLGLAQEAFLSAEEFIAHVFDS
ncbi:putative Sigma non-opioid intracellular receptor 1 [Hypsibius exemplaris]|uniref:Sigma non-opioid intracellular receptor 1 n=1 Tax=Hypsibius exemplaris TaxID=2072580 RepID=A0A1W0X5A7_HYPEX|nr:putative Sigma non-opioid intracellular receptor 1 [Hypsibius exemplaris]